MPLAKDIDDFDFTGTPVNRAQILDLACGAFLAEQRNAVLVGGTGTGKSPLAIAITQACIRGGARGRFYTVIDLVNRLEGEARAGRQGRLAEYLTRMDFVVLDEFGYLPFAQTGGHCSCIGSAGSTSEPRSLLPPTSPLANGRASLATPR